MNRSKLEIASWVAGILGFVLSALVWLSSPSPAKQDIEVEKVVSQNRDIWYYIAEKEPRYSDQMRVLKVAIAAASDGYVGGRPIGELNDLIQKQVNQRRDPPKDELDVMSYKLFNDPNGIANRKTREAGLLRLMSSYPNSPAVRRILAEHYLDMARIATPTTIHRFSEISVSSNADAHSYYVEYFRHTVVALLISWKDKTGSLSPAY